MNRSSNRFEPGQTVAVTQQIPHRRGVWTTRVTGQVIAYEQRKTGSWFAHAKDDKLWLDRLTLRKDDGEIVECILDRYTQVVILSQAPDGQPSVGPTEPHAKPRELNGPEAA